MTTTLQHKAEGIKHSQHGDKENTAGELNEENLYTLLKKLVLSLNI